MFGIARHMLPAVRRQVQIKQLGSSDESGRQQLQAAAKFQSRQQRRQKEPAVIEMRRRRPKKSSKNGKEMAFLASISGPSTSVEPIQLKKRGRKKKKKNDNKGKGKGKKSKEPDPRFPSGPGQPWPKKEAEPGASNPKAGKGGQPPNLTNLVRRRKSKKKKMPEEKIFKSSKAKRRPTSMAHSFTEEEIEAAARQAKLAARRRRMRAKRLRFARQQQQQQQREQRLLIQEQEENAARAQAEAEQARGASGAGLEKQIVQQQKQQRSSSKNAMPSKRLKELIVKLVMSKKAAAVAQTKAGQGRRVQLMMAGQQKLNRAKDMRIAQVERVEVGRPSTSSSSPRRSLALSSSSSRGKPNNDKKLLPGPSAGNVDGVMSAKRGTSSGAKRTKLFMVNRRNAKIEKLVPLLHRIESTYECRDDNGQILQIKPLNEQAEVAFDLGHGSASGPAADHLNEKTPAVSEAHSVVVQIEPNQADQSTQ